jgi:arsenite methyltransferase
MELWMGCLAGAMEEREYRTGLARVGFAAIEIEPTRIYSAAAARRMLAGAASGRMKAISSGSRRWPTPSS